MYPSSLVITASTAPAKGLFEPLIDMLQLTPGQLVIVTGAVTNVACALVGCFLVLRRMSMMGDALSHAVLPGLVIAFLLSGSTSILPLFAGAVLCGLLTTFLTQTLHQYARVPSDASMGVVFTSLFALGVVLVKKYISGLHFDIACIYEGTLELVSLAETIAGVPRPLFTTLCVLILNLTVLLVFWKELKVSSFDPALATTMGFSATAMHYLLMTLVAVTAVASFEAVGSILVVAMLIVPGATAHLLTDRLMLMVVYSAAVGIASSLLGYWAASVWNTNIAGMMTVAAGFLYGLAVLFSPRYGICSKILHNVRMSLRVLREDLLAMLYRVEEIDAEKYLTTAEATQAVDGGWLARLAIREMQQRGRIQRTGDALRLTDEGRQAARKLVRTHRLWETYLVQQLGMPSDHVHEPAHRVEHYIDERLRQELESEVDADGQDPHGRAIPD